MILPTDDVWDLEPLFDEGESLPSRRSMDEQMREFTAHAPVISATEQKEPVTCIFCGKQMINGGPCSAKEKGECSS